ncbi:hypothetical protein ACJ72_08001 [Emergomyces africanus]|uniref:Uncharacterized protein n=1 Tax=Emergomyces africanus TaxID=1955775 RepID=A0A1B7NM54_9EURO|nr:hypothetical protein ACJ72_08001 [Emergomyces africanus]
MKFIHQLNALLKKGFELFSRTTQPVTALRGPREVRSDRGGLGDRAAVRRSDSGRGGLGDRAAVRRSNVIRMQEVNIFYFMYNVERNQIRKNSLRETFLIEDLSKPLSENNSESFDCYDDNIDDYSTHL